MRPDYEQTVMHYKDMVYRIAFVQCQSDADDVFQETFLRLLTCPKEFDSEEHLKAWLIRVTVNCCKLRRRSAKSGKRAELTEDIAASGIDEDCGSDSAAVMTAVLALPEKYRPAVMLRYYEDMSCKEIAAALGLNEATVRTRLARARERLREALKEVWNDEQQ